MAKLKSASPEKSNQSASSASPSPNQSASSASPSPNQSASPSERSIPSNPWTDLETRALIQVFYKKKIKGKRNPTEPFPWDDISITVAAICGFEEPSKTAAQCREKMKKLRKRLNHPSPTPNSCPYLDLMSEYERELSIEMERTTNREVKVAYSFNKENPFQGKLTRTNSDVSIDSSTYSDGYNDSGVEFASTIDHSHFLHVRFFDEENSILVHDPHFVSFRNYIDQQVAEGNPPVQEYTNRSRNGAKITYSYVPETYRSHLKAMPKFIYHLHYDREMATMGFSMDNLVIHDNGLKFWRLKFNSATNKTRMDDMACMADVTMDVFREYKENLPKDMHHFVDMLYRSDGSKKNCSYILNHVALMSSKKRLAFFKSAFAKRGGFNEQKEIDLYDLAITSMPPQKLWYKKKFADDDLHFGPVIKCLNNGEAKYDDFSGHKAANLDLLRCSRNLATHLHEHTLNYLPVASDLDVDLMVSSVFDRELALFQYALYASGLLKHFF